MSDTQNPVYTDNETILGDGTEAHPLSAVALEGAPGALVSITGGDTGSAGLQINGTVSPNNLILDNGETAGTLEIMSDGLLSVKSFSATTQIQDTAGNPMIEVGGTAELGFYGAAIIAKPTVTGSKASGAALVSLLTELVALGLIVDGSSA